VFVSVFFAVLCKKKEQNNKASNLEKFNAGVIGGYLSSAAIVAAVLSADLDQTPQERAVLLVAVKTPLLVRRSRRRDGVPYAIRGVDAGAVVVVAEDGRSKNHMFDITFASHLHHICITFDITFASHLISHLHHMPFL